MKRCSRCKEEKPLEEFPKHKLKRDGRGTTCKKCDAARAREYRKTHHAKEIRKKYLQTDGAKKLYREYRKKSQERIDRWKFTKKGRESIRRCMLRYFDSNPEKYRAHLDVRNAIRQGVLVKPDRCSIDDENCSGRIEAHHPDYSKPLEVIWLCRRHHRSLHGLEEIHEQRKQTLKAIGGVK